MKILVVDDEEDLCEILSFNLETEGYKVDVAYSAEEALTKNIALYDLLLLDVMMGNISGFRLAKMLHEKKETENLPIIFLTAKDTENDMLTGFGIGADDYITKPFSIREVQARVKAVLRRNNKLENISDKETPLSYETLNIFPESKKVTIDEKEIFLTKKEWEILYLFMKNKNHVFSREDILQQIWTDEICVLDRTVDVNITRLRRKIGHYGKNIVTRLGYGYCFEEKPI